MARDLLITPLAYVAWQSGLLYWAVPQLVKWAAVVLLLSIAVIWQLIPDFSHAERGSACKAYRPRAAKSKRWPFGFIGRAHSN